MKQALSGLLGFMENNHLKIHKYYFFLKHYLAEKK